LTNLLRFALIRDIRRHSCGCFEQPSDNRFVTRTKQANEFFVIKVLAVRDALSLA